MSEIWNWLEGIGLGQYAVLFDWQQKARQRRAQAGRTTRRSHTFLYLVLGRGNPPQT